MRSPALVKTVAPVHHAAAKPWVRDVPQSRGEILRYNFFHSVAPAVLAGVLVWFQAGVLGWMVPR